MKRRIRNIVWLMCISIFGIVTLQVIWIVNSYEINKNQLLRDVNQALTEAVQEEYNLRFSSFAEINTSDSATVVISSAENATDINLDSLFGEVFETDSGLLDDGYTINIDASDLKSDGELNEMPENLDFKLKAILKSLLLSEVKGENIIDTKRIDSLIKVKFDSQKIIGNYYLETSHSQDSFPIVKSAIVSSPIPISILKKNYVRVVFKSKYQTVFARMLGIIFASFVLIIIAVLSFIYMLRTILRQRKLSEIKNDFINNMTHELKTPIATVSTAIEAMLNFGALDDIEKTNRYLNISYKELQRLSGLIEKVLNVSRLERKSVELHKEDIDVIEVFNDITEKYKTANIKKIEFNNPKQIRTFKVFADRTHLTNVLNNLIDNAIKYSDESVKIEMNCYTENGLICISIGDNGWGISKENQKKIFDKFFRVPKGDVHNVKGFGLGLHYVYNIIAQHGGDVEVKSVLGKGSEFVIKLPENE